MVNTQQVCYSLLLLKNLCGTLGIFIYLRTIRKSVRIFPNKPFPLMLYLRKKYTMKQKLLLTLLLIFASKSFSQESKFSIELNYPIPIGNNFIEESYSGIIDIGVDYRFANLNPINVGISLNSGVLLNNSNLNNGFQNFKVTSYVIQPRLFGELNLESIRKLHPSIGIGYTFMVFKSSGMNNGFDISDENYSLSGFNFNFGLSYDVTEKLFTQVQYDFVKLGVDDGVPDIKYNTNINILKIGLGYRL